MPEPTTLITALTVSQLSYIADYFLAKVVAIGIVFFITVKFIGFFRFGGKK